MSHLRQLLLTTKPTLFVFRTVFPALLWPELVVYVEYVGDILGPCRS